jgi:hypothetical protein
MSGLKKALARYMTYISLTLYIPVASHGEEIAYDKFNNEFDKMQVQMADGEKVPLGSLPWFQLAFGIHQGKHAARANSAYWVITSRAGHCAYGWSYRLRWGAPLTAGDINKAVGDCNKAVKNRMKGATSTQIEACQCRPVLTSKSGINFTFFSGDDDLLRTGAWNYPVEISGGGQSLFGLFSVSPKGIFIKNYDGENYCFIGGAGGNGYKPTPERMMALLSGKETSRPIKCFGEKKSGNIFSAGVQYVPQKDKVNGTAKIRFDDGEVLNVVFGD